MKEFAQAEASKFIDDLKTKGYTRIEAMMSPEEIARCLSLINSLHAADEDRNLPDRVRSDKRDKMLYNLQNKDKFFLDLLVHPTLVLIFKYLLNDPYYKYLPGEMPNYILNYFNARSSGPYLPLHTDTFVPSPGEQTWTAQAAFVLEDSRLDNGCTLLVPGSHLSGKFVDRKSATGEPLLANAGDVVIWDSRIWHGAGENLTDQTRWSIIATFSCWWVKQRTDIPRGLPDNIYKQLSAQQKIMLGYCSIPPLNEKDRLNFKSGLEALLPSVQDYYRESVNVG